MKNTALKNYTGERLETFIESEVAVEHLHRYALALSFIQGMKVLDIASGEGYGSSLMAGAASEVTGVDISAGTIEDAKKKYNQSNLNFLVGSADKIPAAAHSFDVVVSFETLEHHDKHEEMFTEIKRVLKPEGILIMSSPDKLYYTDKRKFFNKHHVKELYEREFKDIVMKNFSNSQFYFQRSTFASLLVPESEKYIFKEFTGNYENISVRNEFGQLYILAIASDRSLSEPVLSAFTDDGMMNRLNNATITNVRNTASYKIGHLLLMPLKVIKNLFLNSGRAR